MIALAAWAFGVALLAQQGRTLAAEQARLDLARQRAAMLHALQRIRDEESVARCRDCLEGLHAHEILLLVDRGLGTKHRCRAPKEWLER